MEATLRALQNHVASHLEELALFVLPAETNDDDADANSHHAERPREKDSRLDDDETSSLGSFGKDEDGQAPFQAPKAFETALKNKEEYLQPQVGDWLNNNDGDYSPPEAEDYLYPDIFPGLYRVKDEVHVQGGHGVDPRTYKIWKILGNGQYMLSRDGKSDGKVYKEEDLRGEP